MSSNSPRTHLPLQVPALTPYHHEDTRNAVASTFYETGDDLREGPRLDAPSQTTATSVGGTDFPLHELRNSSPATQEDWDNEATEVVADRSNLPWKAKWQLASACLMNFGNGMNDSAPGALIPYVETDYGIGYAIVSLFFISNALGFIIAAPLTHTIDKALGRRGTYALSMGLLTTGYTVIVCHPPFPVIVTAFFLLGFGMALSIALNNVFCANLPDSTTALGCFAGSYGIGGVISPLIATVMVSKDIRWSLFYTIAMAVSMANLALSLWAFAEFEVSSPLRTAAQSTSSSTVNNEPNSRIQVLKMALRSRTTVFGSLFIFVYQGAEVSVSGWVVSFLIDYRGGNPSHVGYVSAGFWAGITLGRFLLVYPAHRFGEKISVSLMVAGAVVFQLMVWLIPNVVGEAVAVAILGVLLGAVFPCATAVFAKLLPRKIQLSSLSFISALGSSGGAVFPFLTGILAQNVGTLVLHPICLALYGAMAISWSLLPKIVKPSD
ncbi:hypothetical protein N7501_010465 [Penicillium viridicatum]|nr:hypothetical protein N7501_010465 [Penicillium viridicatum]